MAAQVRVGAARREAPQIARPLLVADTKLLLGAALEIHDPDAARAARAAPNQGPREFRVHVEHDRLAAARDHSPSAALDVDQLRDAVRRLRRLREGDHRRMMGPRTERGRSPRLALQLVQARAIRPDCPGLGTGRAAGRHRECDPRAIVRKARFLDRLRTGVERALVLAEPIVQCQAGKAVAVRNVDEQLRTRRQRDRPGFDGCDQACGTHAPSTSCNHSSSRPACQSAFTPRLERNRFGASSRVLRYEG